MKKKNGLFSLFFTGLLISGGVQAAGETGQVNVTQVKVSSNYTQIFFENVASNPDNCGSTASVVVESVHTAKREIYSSAMAALNAKLPAHFDVDGCSTTASNVSLPVVTAITVGAQ